MDTVKRIDSFEAFLEWNKTLPEAHRAVYSEASNALVLPMATRSWMGNPPWTSTYAAGSAWYGLGDGQLRQPSYQVASANTRWYFAREVIRFALPVSHPERYEPLPTTLWTLATDNQATPLSPVHFIRLCKQDMTSVEFYFTVEDAMRDKPTTMSWGRYLAKFLPWLLPKSIQTLEAKLRAEVVDDFDVFMGGRNIIKYYNNGPHSCMVFDANKWGSIDNHVLMAYDGPGWGIAIIPQDEAKTRASARSLVWHNPQNENDKRYIRVYGDAVLERRLQRKGYVNEAPVPATFKYVPATDRLGHILLPYFDHTGGNKNNDCGYLFLDTHAPVSMTREEWNKKKLDPILAPYLVYQHHNALYVPDKRFPGYRCACCGNNEKDLTLRPSYNGLVCNFCIKEQDYVHCFDGAAQSFRPRCQTSQLADGTVFYDTPATRKHLNVVQLDPLYYGGSAFARRVIGMVKKNDHYWLRKDTATVYFMNDTDGLHTQHFNVLDNAWVDDKYERLSPRTQNEKLYCDKALVSNIMTSSSGRTILPKIHDSYVAYATDIKRCEHVDSIPRGTVSFSFFDTIRLAQDSEQALNTKLHDIEVKTLVASMRKYSLDFFTAVRNCCVQPAKNGFRVGFSPCYYADAEKMLEQLLAPVDELYFAKYEKTLGIKLTDSGRNALVCMRDMYLQIKAEWDRVEALHAVAALEQQPA